MDFLSGEDGIDEITIRVGQCSPLERRAGQVNEPALCSNLLGAGRVAPRHNQNSEFGGGSAKEVGTQMVTVAIQVVTQTHCCVMLHGCKSSFVFTAGFA